MEISTFSMNGDGATRNVCVVNGQAFYQSSGTSSHLPGVWLPFRGVTDDTFASILGMIQKPLVTHNSRAKITHYFPPEVAEVIKGFYPNVKQWGRFQNMSCLIISCMLSPHSIPEPIKEAVLKYIAPNVLPTPTFHQSSEPPITLENENVEEINSRLLEMGAMAVPVPDDPELESHFALKEIQYDSNEFDVHQFIQNCLNENVTQRFKHTLGIRRSGVLATESNDSDASGITDRETDSEDTSSRSP